MVKRLSISRSGKRIILGITGASGAIFAERFMKECPGAFYVIPTIIGKKVFESEIGKPIESVFSNAKKIFDPDDFFVPFASGSVEFEALVILPCSASTMAKIANGIADNVLTRVAQVALKERRKLIIGLREAPLSTIALRNATVLSEAGAIIFPLCPGFYFKPRTVEDLVDSVVQRICSLIGAQRGRGFLSEEIE